MTAALILPHVTAGLNALTTVLLIIGYSLIRSRHREAHRMVMLAAVGVSVAFLIAYLTYHVTAPIFKFAGPETLKPYYYGLLISHVVMAALSVPLVLVTVLRALRGRVPPHRRLARWTLPIWLYSSVTGILVYLALYHVYPPSA